LLSRSVIRYSIQDLTSYLLV